MAPQPSNQDTELPKPDYEEGIKYWNNQTADLDGVLGGYGSGTLPRVDALGSRQFLQYLIPPLCTVPSASRPLVATLDNSRRKRALDVGAGIGRVTQTVLLHLFSDVVLLEPVEKFVQEAFHNCQASLSAPPTPSKRWKGIADKSKSVTFLQGALQQFDPSHPERSSTRLGRLGHQGESEETKFDVIWCQWCLGHLSDEALVEFFIRAKAALRASPESFIVVKENLCRDGTDDTPRTVYDEQDSSLTRSDAAWLRLFQMAQLTVVRQLVQEGLPAGLYTVKMYALRG